MSGVCRSASIIEKMKYKKRLQEYNKHKSIIFSAVAENDKIANENGKRSDHANNVWANSLDSRISNEPASYNSSRPRKLRSGGFSLMVMI